MVQLGIIYDRDNDVQNAGLWFSRAVKGGNSYGKKRLDILEKRLKKSYGFH